MICTHYTIWWCACESEAGTCAAAKLFSAFFKFGDGDALSISFSLIGPLTSAAGG